MTALVSAKHQLQQPINVCLHLSIEPICCQTVGVGASPLSQLSQMYSFIYDVQLYAESLLIQIQTDLFMISGLWNDECLFAVATMT